jgi:Rod binding domain-containing protein
MTDMSAASAVPLNALKPTALAAPTPAQTASRAAIHKTAQAFESQFISAMLGEMFEGVNTSAPFGGGEGEQAFKSFLMDAMAKQMTKAGGIGVAASVQKEMLKMQGLS